MYNSMHEKVKTLKYAKYNWFYSNKNDLNREQFLSNFK